MDTPDFCVHCVTDCEAWVGMTPPVRLDLSMSPQYAYQITCRYSSPSPPAPTYLTMIMIASGHPTVMLLARFTFIYAQL